MQLTAADLSLKYVVKVIFRTTKDNVANMQHPLMPLLEVAHFKMLESYMTAILNAPRTEIA